VKPLYVQGMGLWMPGVSSVAAYCGAREEVAGGKPPAALLEGASKRRASLLTRMAIEVFEQAAVQAQADASCVESVWAIVHGEICTAVELMAMMNQAEGKLSPTKFHNSVYNTASGYASIACKNRAPSVTLTGGRELVASALIEAAGLLHAGARQVVIVCADEPHPAPFESARPRTPLALALCVSRDSTRARGCLTDLKREVCKAEPLADGFDGMYVAAGLPLVERIERRKPGRLALEAGEGEAVRWSCELSF